MTHVIKMKYWALHKLAEELGDPKQKEVIWNNQDISKKHYL